MITDDVFIAAVSYINKVLATAEIRASHFSEDGAIPIITASDIAEAVRCGRNIKQSGYPSSDEESWSSDDSEEDELPIPQDLHEGDFKRNDNATDNAGDDGGSKESEKDSGGSSEDGSYRPADSSEEEEMSTSSDESYSSEDEMVDWEYMSDVSYGSDDDLYPYSHNAKSTLSVPIYRLGGEEDKDVPTRGKCMRTLALLFLLFSGRCEGG